MGVRAGVASDHRYQTCTDEFCDRYICRIYREGFQAGQAAGYAGGYAEGRADGYEDGYSDAA